MNNPNIGMGKEVPQEPVSEEPQEKEVMPPQEPTREAKEEFPESKVEAKTPELIIEEPAGKKGETLRPMAPQRETKIQEGDLEGPINTIGQAAKLQDEINYLNQ